MLWNMKRMDLLKRRWIWLCRFRHRRGYGVHSPFAFNFLTDVVYGKDEYYAYRTLKSRFNSGNWLDRSYRLKCNRFLFRLANYVHPREILLYGDFSDEACAYLSEGCRCELIRAVENSHCPVKIEADRLICISESVAPAAWQAIVGNDWTLHSVCVIRGICRDEEAKRYWHELQKLPQAVVTFDLYEYGLIFYDLSKQRQHYIIIF